MVFLNKYLGGPESLVVTRYNLTHAAVPTITDFVFVV